MEGVPWDGFEVVWFECLGGHHTALKVIESMEVEQSG